MRSPIALENEHEGTSAFRLTRPATNHEVEGYGSEISLKAGLPLQVRVNVSVESTVRWEVFRLGHYQGFMARRILDGEPVVVAPQSPCPVAQQTRLRECHWQVAFNVDTEPEWTSGYYLIKLTRDDGFDAYVPFVLTEASPRAPVVVQASVTTWQAYNGWGDVSLYEDDADSDGPTAERAVQVSFDRPFGDMSPEYSNHSNASDIGAANVLRTDLWLISWLEERGYDVAYVTNIDVDRDPELLKHRRAFISVGHDEYWSVPMRDAVERARAGGVALLFFSANTSYWRVRLEPSGDGIERRVMTCYKGDPSDPRAGEPDESSLFRNDPHARPEANLLGVQYETWTRTDAFPLIVTNPKHWVFAGTGVSQGESLGNLVGYEWDHVSKDHSPPGLEVLGRSPAIGASGQTVVSDMAIYETNAGSFVFASGTIVWVWGLGKPGYQNERVGKICENLLSRAKVPAAAPTAGQFPPLVGQGGPTRALTTLAGAGEPGYADGPAGKAKFNYPTGVAVASDGTIFVADTRNHRIRQLSPNGVVSTLAGCGPTDESTGSYRDGTGTNACFDTPVALALGPDDALYVADSGSHRIRRVTRTGRVTTYAGGDPGTRDGSLTTAQFKTPMSLTFAPDGSLYVGDGGSNRIRRLTQDGVTTLEAAVPWPLAMTASPTGTLYVASGVDSQLLALDGESRSVLANDAAAPGCSDGPAGDAALRPGTGLVLVGQRLLFSEGANYALRVLDLERRQVSQLVGTCPKRGASARAQLALPRGLAIMGSRLLVTDSGNHRLVAVDLTP